MSGRALSWATAVREQQSTICCHLEDFMAEVRKVFDSPVSGRVSASNLLELRQNSRSVADYKVDFCTLAAESAWSLFSIPFFTDYLRW
jgi:hypothetical protein